MRLDTIFLDRDGVINRRLPDAYVRNWTEFEFLPGAKQALRLLCAAGLRLIVVTNQRGIARGLLTEAELLSIHERMRAELDAAGAQITAIYHCPHDNNECRCRKPAPGMLLQAQRDFPDIDFSASLLIGDSLSDIQAGQRAGCRTLLIRADARDEDEQADEAAALASEGTAPSLYHAALYCLRPRQAQT